MIRAVTFDFWDTLVVAPKVTATRASRRDRLLGVLADVAPGVTAAQVDEALTDIRREFDEKWAANEQYTGWDATNRLIADLGLDVDGAQRDLIGRRFMSFDDPWLPDLTPNIESTLRALKGHGVAVGIICDVGLSPSVVLRSYLERHGVLDLFDHWSFSDEVGTYKPDPAIFDHALSGLGGIDAEHAAHVGDLRRTDVAGAYASGVLPVRYAGSNDDADPDDRGADAPHVIVDHADLLAVLGLGT